MAPFIRRSARLTCTILCTFSIVSVFTRLVAVSILSDWVLPYPAGYGFPLPFGGWPSLLKPSLPLYGYVPPLPLAYWWITTRPYRGYHVPLPQAATDVGVLFIAVDRVVFQNWDDEAQFLGCTDESSTARVHMCHRSEFKTPHPFTFRWVGVTRPQQGFTGVRPVGLSLACRSGEADPLDITPSASQLPPLPAAHVRVGTGLNTGRERYDPLTLWKRLRVALGVPALVVCAW